jgi:putative transposase
VNRAGGRQLQAGTQVRHLEETYVIESLLDVKTVLAYHPASKRKEVLLVSQLRSAEPETPPPARVHPDLTTVSDEDWAVARERFETIRPLLEVPPYQRSRELVAARAEACGKSASTVYRWMDLYTQTGRLSALLPQPRRDRGRGRLETDVETVIAATLEEWINAKPRLPVQDACDLVRSRCKNAGLAVPATNTVRSRIAALGERARLERLVGKRKAKSLLKPLTGSFPGADYPLAVVQIDHTPLDVILVDDVHRRAVGRPWLTVAEDVYSRMVLGIHVSFEPPSANSVGLCLTHAILPKEQWLARRDVARAWPCWGFPRRIQVDNGKEFRGVMLERACAEYGIDLEWRPPLTPEVSGHIERVIGTINREMHRLPGTTFSNPKERADYDSDAAATLTLSDLERLLAEWITGVYHERVHNGIKTAPRARFEHGVIGDAHTPGVGLPDPNDPRLDPHRLRLDFMPLFKRKIRRTGVQIDCIHYQGEPLYRHIQALRAGERHSKREFIIRRDPRDVSTVYFFDPDLNEYFSLPYRNATHPALSAWELREVRRWMEEHGVKQSDETAIFAARERMQRIRSEADATTKAARRRQQRSSDADKREKPAVSARAATTTPAAPPPRALPTRVVEAFADSVVEWEEDA